MLVISVCEWTGLIINMEQLAHFVTKSFEYNNNRVMDVINMTQNTRSLLCGDPFRSVASVDRISSKSTNRGGDDEASSGLDDEENTMDIDITDFSTDDEDIGDAKKANGVAGQRGANGRDSTELGITSTLLRLSAANFRNAMGRFENIEGEGKGLFGRTHSGLSETTKTDTTKQIVKKKYATKNWLISDSPKRTEDSGKLLTFV